MSSCNDPPGYDKPNLRKVFSFLEKVCRIAASDTSQIFDNFFPLKADLEALGRHGGALKIPRYDSDSDETYRKRVATASFYMMHRGERQFFRAFFAQRFPMQVWQLLETWMHLTAKVQASSIQDRAWIREFLDSELDPNIGFDVVDLELWIEQLALADFSAVKAVSSDLDAWESGLQCDGRILADHGDPAVCDGAVRADGTYRQGSSLSRAGSWTGWRVSAACCDGVCLASGKIKADGFVWLPSAMQQVAASCGSCDRDTLGLVIRRVGLRHSVCNGLRRCDGSDLADGRARG